jgi:hypothetical protein
MLICVGREEQSSCTIIPPAIQRDVAQPLGISVHDHIIVGKDGHASLKGLKLI